MDPGYDQLGHDYSMVGSWESRTGKTVGVFADGCSTCTCRGPTRARRHSCHRAPYHGGRLTFTLSDQGDFAGMAEPLPSHRRERLPVGRLGPLRPDCRGPRHLRHHRRRIYATRSPSHDADDGLGTWISSRASRGRLPGLDA